MYFYTNKALPDSGMAMMTGWVAVRFRVRSPLSIAYYQKTL
jgi:hypothetical protein